LRVSDDGKKVYAVVTQISRRKPILKKPLSTASVSENTPPDSARPPPAWQRTPMRVTLQAAGGEAMTFDVVGAASLIEEGDADDEP